MKHTYRFFGSIQSRQDQGGVWLLESEEAKHLIKVLRLKSGDQVEVFDGQGSSSLGCAEIKGKEVRVVTEHIEVTSANSGKLNLVLGVLKPQSMDKLLPSLVELGVDRLDLFLQGQSEKSRMTEKVQQRWQKIVLASCKQSKRAFFPDIVCHSKLSEALEIDVYSSAKKLHFSEFGDPFSSDLSFSGPVRFLVGSERGLTANEQELVEANGFKPVKISDTILTAYTAAIAGTSLVSAFTS